MVYLFIRVSLFHWDGKVLTFFEVSFLRKHTFFGVTQKNALNDCETVQSQVNRPYDAVSFVALV